jgi:lipopolysaccharide export system protein LptC
MHDSVTPFIGAGRGQLDDDSVAILVGDDARQAIRFGMDQAQALLTAQLRQRLAARHGGSDATLEEGVID